MHTKVKSPQKTTTPKVRKSTDRKKRDWPAAPVFALVPEAIRVNYVVGRVAYRIDPLEGRFATMILGSPPPAAEPAAKLAPKK